MSSDAVADNQKEKPVRGTQLLVEHLGVVLRRPSLIAIEIAWRWLFGIPFLLACWNQIQKILAAYPLRTPESIPLIPRTPGWQQRSSQASSLTMCPTL